MTTTTSRERPMPLTGALTSLALSMLLASLGTSIANVGLPVLAQTFQAPFSQVQWIVLAYVLAVTALTVAAGRLGDMVGRRHLLRAGLVLFTVASALCGLAPTIGLLVAARALQGAGAAVMMALPVAMVNETVDKSRVGGGMGLLGTSSALGTALGPSLGGLLMATFGWRALFLATVPIGALAWALTGRCLAGDSRPGRLEWSAFDGRGVVLLVSSLAAYALAMTSGRGGFGWPSGALLLGAIVAAALFVHTERRARWPLIDIAIVRDRVLGTSLVLSALVSTVMMATLVVGPFYLSRGLGLDAVTTGLALSVGPAVAALAGVPAGRLTDRRGPARVTIVGLAALLAGLAALSALPATVGLAGYLAPLALGTAGYAFFQTANNTAVMADVRADHRGVTSGLLSLARNLGLTTGASLMGAVFAVASAPGGAASAADAVAAGMRATFAVATLLIVAALALAVAAPRLSAPALRGSSAPAPLR